MSKRFLAALSPPSSPPSSITMPSTFAVATGSSTSKELGTQPYPSYTPRSKR